jgi:hypothetical protein
LTPVTCVVERFANAGAGRVAVSPLLLRPIALHRQPNGFGLLLQTLGTLALAQPALLLPFFMSLLLFAPRLRPQGERRRRLTRCLLFAALLGLTCRHTLFTSQALLLVSLLSPQILLVSLPSPQILLVSLLSPQILECVAASYLSRKPVLLALPPTDVPPRLVAFRHHPILVAIGRAPTLVAICAGAVRAAIDRVPTLVAINPRSVRVASDCVAALVAVGPVSTLVAIGPTQIPATFGHASMPAAIDVANRSVAPGFTFVTSTRNVPILTTAAEHSGIPRLLASAWLGS